MTMSYDDFDEEVSYEGFQELFEAFNIESRGEKTRAEIGIYRRVEDSLGENVAVSDDPEAMLEAGNLVASMYADYLKSLEDNQELNEDFYSQSVEGRLHSVETNPMLVKYLE